MAYLAACPDDECLSTVENVGAHQELREAAPAVVLWGQDLKAETPGPANFALQTTARPVLDT